MNFLPHRADHRVSLPAPSGGLLPAPLAARIPHPLNATFPISTCGTEIRKAKFKNILHGHEREGGT